MALDITEERVRAAAARLHDGGWWFSARQLYYAVCADVETPPVRVASGEVGLGVLLILVGLITGQRTVLVILGVIGLMLVIVGTIAHVQERRPLPLTRMLAISYADFERRFLQDEHDYAGLAAPVPSSAATTGATLVVCDRADTTAMLEANAEHIGDVSIALRGSEPDEVRGQRMVVLHDCDPAGCGLVAELRDRGADVVDAGINPAELALRRLQLLEGAPARLTRDLSGHLDAAQIDWLLSGRRLECATETPEQLVQRIRAALADGPDR
jgi:hypothetical protein